MLLRGLAGAYGYSFAILRYMNVYGPGQRAGVVPGVSMRLLAGERPQLQRRRQPGLRLRAHRGCASANLLALASDIDGEDFNVGHGSVASLNELVAIVGEILGSPLEPTYAGEKITAPPRVGDVSKPREMLGFVAQVELADGLRTVLDELSAAQAVQG